ncbi:MAG: hypothetical protein JWL90_701 [Chthoniobacteraceae bacterium]|nr:hypothetical protein [Chthoniobacteraceae bacterium]
MIRRVVAFFCVFIIGLLAAELLRYPSPFGERTSGLAARRIAFLTEENDRLRALVVESEKAEALEKSKARRAAVERDVEAIRGLKFKTPVDYQVLDRKQIKAVIEGKLAEVFSEQEFVNITTALSRLGLLEAGFPLRQKYIDLLGEQVAAFYDQHQHKLFMFEDASLENEQNRVVLSHELTHALQDQHFGLSRLPLEIKTDDDRAAAASALCEGEATLVMSEFMLKNLSLGSLKSALTASLTQNMDQIAKAPRYLREMLVFPYLRGQEFCGALFSRGGYAALTKAYENPPSSTAQILHPEKFVGEEREEPIRIEWPDLRVKGQAPIADNVLGEMGIRILFTEWLDAAAGEHASAGWRGDRYLCFEHGLVWKTVWASAQQAAAFIEAEKKTFAKRYASEPGRVTRALLQNEREVLVIDTADEAWAAALEAQFGK